MVSGARIAFNNNAADIKDLLDLNINTEFETSKSMEVLNKSAIVLLTAFWEAYCEDIASEALEHLVLYSESAEKLPTELKKFVSQTLKSDRHELAIWQLSGDGWRTYLTSRLEQMKADRDRKLNTPKTQQIDTLFHETIGLEKISSNWKWRKDSVMTIENARTKLDEMVTLRGAIAHRGSHSSKVTADQVADWFDFVKNITGRTGGAVNKHVREATGRPMWE